MNHADMQKVLNSPFNIETHKKTFINYLEIVIDKEGICYYAVPSHNGILEMFVCKKYGIKFNSFDFSIKAGELCPKNKIWDYCNWLCEETECIMVWGLPYSNVVGNPNDKQQRTLELLKKEGLF